MTINYLVDFEKGSDSIIDFNELPSIFDNKYLSFTTKVYALENTSIAREISLIDNVSEGISLIDSELIIVSEPYNNSIDTEKLFSFKKSYLDSIDLAKSKGIPVVHIVTNPKWHLLFEDIIREYDIQIFIPQSHQEILQLPEEKIINVKEYIDLKSFVNYQNDINDNILLDLTMAYDKKHHYKINFSSLMEKVKNFSSIEIIINEESFVPEFNDTNIKVYKESEYPLENFNKVTYIYYHSNKPYDMQNVDKLLFYAANSKVIYSNYNYYINNLLPSVIMNLSKTTYNIELLPKKEAMDIINENRNTVLFNNTSINIINDLCSLFLNKHYVEPYALSDVLNDFTNNMYIKQKEASNVIELTIDSFKYDLEKTLTLPIIFMGKGVARYGMNTAVYEAGTSEIHIPLYEEKQSLNKSVKKELSMIVPIHNNGRYLKYKCFNSILRLTCLEQLEIIFIDDGSSDEETLRIIRDLRTDYPGIVYKRFETGSGSASRPRNVGMRIASCKYITFLDPDNEAIEDGYTVLLNELKSEDNLDMVVADIVREDNIKRNDISYYRKVMKVRTSPYVKDMRKLLLDTNLSVQSIQALIVKKDIIDEHNLTMIEGAAGQDTLFFQELLLKCKTVKVLEKNVHSYYAFVEGSVTNTVSYRFFEKFYKVEIERKKFLEREDIIDFYMDIRFNNYMKNWYYKKLEQVSSDNDEKRAREIILKIFELYSDFEHYYDEYSESFRKDLKSLVV